MSAAVDVLMPVRGEGRFLAPALASLLAQSLTDLRLVVVDDGAGPEARALLDAHAARDGRVHVLRTPEHAGLAAALNHGLAACEAPLVARADADDVYRPDRLARQAAAFAARPALGALSCGYRRIDEEGRVTGRRVPVTGPARVAFYTLFASPLSHPGAMARTEVLRRAKGYDVACWTAQDTDLWARLAMAGTQMDNDPAPLLDWRAHGGSVMARRGEAGMRLSYAVTAERQARYLSAPLDRDLTRAVNRVWRAWEPADAADLRAGEAGLVRILRAAEAREPAEVVRFFRGTTARALLRHARWRARRDPAGAAWAAARAAAWRLGGPIGRPAAPAPAGA